MELQGTSILKIYASSTDKLGGKLLYEHITELAKEKGLSGVTVYRGIMGFGSSSRYISTSKYWELTEKLPVVIEMIGDTLVLEEFYKLIQPELYGMSKGCVVTMEEVKVLMVKKGGAE